MRTSIVAILGTTLGICGCAPVHPVGSGPDISDTLQSLKLDTSDAGEVAAFANALLAGSEIDYQLQGREVSTVTKHRSFLDRATDTGTRRMVQVVVLTGEGTRDEPRGRIPPISTTSETRISGSR